jgi:hypothetical protein
MQDGSRQRLNRTRRNLLKAAGVVAGAVIATPVMPAKEADAQWWCWWYVGNVCFGRARAPPDRDTGGLSSGRKGDEISARFAGIATIADVTSFTLSRTGLAGTWAGASRPVRVKAGALGENAPTAEICLAASHAVFVDGVLVPVVNLVNGTSMVFETAEGKETLDFFHVALGGHDVIDACGAPCESWRDPELEEPCVPLLSFYGDRDQLRSRLRSAASIVLDRRQPLDIIRDPLEERGLRLAKAA